jgi:hypothetical protein
MQQNHPPLRINVEQYSLDAVLREMRPYFANAATEGSAYRHPDRPSKLDSLDIFTDELAILGRWQAFQPFPERSPPASVRKKIAGTRYRASPSLGAVRVRLPAPLSASLPRMKCTTYGTNTLMVKSRVAAKQPSGR